jgi:hypothetical protein
MIPATRIKSLYGAMNYLGFETGAFSQLTRQYMLENFNPKTPDIDGIRYYSYGASLEPSFWSVFFASHSIIKRIEGGLNDGLVRYMLPCAHPQSSAFCSQNQCIVKSMGRLQGHSDRCQPSRPDQLDEPIEVVVLGSNWGQEKVRMPTFPS